MKATLGFFWLCVMFAACFSVVHIALSVLHGQKKKPAQQEVAASKPENENSENAKATTKANANASVTPEPVYYIVEKTRRKKSSYSKPKRIKFE
jgi:hypothetical protein